MLHSYPNILECPACGNRAAAYAGQMDCPECGETMDADTYWSSRLDG